MRIVWISGRKIIYFFILCNVLAYLNPLFPSSCFSPCKIFIFFCILCKEKVFEFWKFSIFGFKRIYMFWNVLQTISLFLQNICLSAVGLSECDTNFVTLLAQKIMNRIMCNFVLSCTKYKLVPIRFWLHIVLDIPRGKPIGGVLSVGVILRNPSPYLRVFRRKPRKTPNG